MYSEKPLDIQAHFQKQSIEAKAKDVFFNVLTVRNNSNQTAQVTLNITVPGGWGVIGKDKMEIQISPLDSIIIPLRIAVGSQVRGDIGYSVIASLADERGNTIKNEYCYVKIPRITDLKVRILDRLSYLDPFSGMSNFSIQIVNNGNRDEPVGFYLDGKNHLIVGQDKQNLLVKDILLKSYSDTTIVIPVTLQTSEVFKRNSYGLEVTSTTIDTVFKSTVWFQRLDSKFNNFISSTEKPLVISLIGMGLLDANRNPTLSAVLEGKILFKGENDFYYYYRNYSSEEYSDFLQNNRLTLGYNYKKWNFEYGDNFQVFHTRFYGRGGYVNYRGEKVKANFLLNKEKDSNISNFGAFVTYNINKDFSINSGGAYSNNPDYTFESRAAVIGFGTKIFNHSINANFIYNIVNRNIDGVNTHNEFGTKFSYKSKFRKLDNSINAFYNSPFFYGNQPGYLRVYARSNYNINKSNRIILSYAENIQTKPFVRNDITIRTQRSRRQEPKLEYHFNVNSNARVYAGPSIERTEYSGLSSMPLGSLYESLTYKLNVGARFKDTYGEFSITPTAEIGRVNIITSPIEGEPSREKFFNYQYFSLNFMSRHFSVLAFYTSGPRTPFDQVNRVIFSKAIRKIHVIPTFTKFLYKDVVEARSSISYSSDIVNGSMYTNMTGQLYWYLPNYWTVNGLLVYTLQSRTNAQEVVEKYQNYYFEIGLKKEFDIAQPRVKYYDVSLNFFKDFNGNFTRESNEQGIKNVLVRISKIGSDVKGFIPSDIFSAELISDNSGVVKIDNIPEGLYKFEYNPISSEAGTFSKALENNEIYIRNSGNYYFPFVEKNKVFGKIILNRSRLSGLGRVDVSNVRVNATDSQGRTYSTLTDKNGEFILFAPSTDEYILTINNIFYENFDLRQNNFLVHFNGYKQFEVNFVFDEKVRRINFAATDQEVRQGVQQVRRTTVSGSVKDVNTQQPVRARINLINTRTNTIVTSVNSSATSGEYTLNFMAADNYLIEVLADDYWYLSENLVLQQVTTFMNLNRDILLRPISVGSKVELNIRFDVNSAFLNPEAVAELNRLLRQMKNNPSIRLEIQGHCDDLEAIQKPGIGQERAGAVARYLIENGFSNVEVKDMKNSVPTTSNDTEEGRMRNRRIEVVVLRR
ncbi:MAG: OmpA family protein [Tenuifilaceae bacterium]|nr:OmpA family protein [Tenuifilaceae bacterium]